jgi:hypothetical protein
MKRTRHILWIAAVVCASAFGMQILPPGDDGAFARPILPPGDDYVGGGGGGGRFLPPPRPRPLPPPTAPAFMTYTPFTETPTLQVRWEARGNATNYVLDRLADGVWSRVYEGPATSVDVTLPGNGVYRFRVAACNANGCSGYRVDEEMRMSFGPDRQTGGAGSGPFMSAPAESAPLPGVNALATDSGTHELLPILGAASDQLRQELTANRCLDTVGAEILNQPARMKDYLFTHVRTRDELATSLGLTSTLGVSAKYGKFSGSYSGKKTLLSESNRVEETSMIVAELTDQMRVETLSNHSLRPLDPVYVNRLTAGDTAGFRNMCGDGYVYSIAYGRQVYLTFQLRSLKYSTDEIQQKTAGLKLDLGSWIGLGSDNTKKTEIHTKYEKYEVNVRVVSYGSAAVVSGVVDFARGLQYLQDFENEPPGNEYPFSHLVKDYIPPAGTPFPDYRPIQQPLQLWYSFDHQIATRCEFFDDNLYPIDAMAYDTNAKSLLDQLSLREDCYRMKLAVQENMQNCEDTRKWGQCIYPDEPICIVANEADNCLTYASKFPRWNMVPVSVWLKYDMGGGLKSKTVVVRGDVCFGGVPTMLDLRIASVDCTGGGCPKVLKGITVTGGGIRSFNGWNSWNPTNTCLHAEVTLNRRGWWKSGAHVDQTHTANGMQPTYPSYLIR